MTMAMELAVAISAVEKGAEKPPCWIIAGISTQPRAATVAGDRTEEAGYDDTHDGDAAAAVPNAGIYKIDQSSGDTGFCHDISGKYEKWDR